MSYKSKILTFVCLAVFCFFIFRLLKIENKPNIVFVTFDALRPDHLGCYGYSRNTSPNIDQIAKEGTLFLNAIAQASFTPASLSSILTSAYPQEHGVFDFSHRISKVFVPVFNKMGMAGYHSAFFSNHIGISSIEGFDSYFNNFCVIRAYKQDADSKEIIDASKLNKRIINWIKLNKRKHFFLWVHYLTPHYPMYSPSEYRRIFLGKGSFGSVNNISITESPKDYVGFKGLPRRLVKLNNGMRDLNYYINLYDASIRYADAQFAEIVDCLRTLNLYKKTMIIIGSDHGEGIGEHELYFTHRYNLYDELIKVPLIIKFSQPFIKGKRIITQVRNIDIIPTILEIMGIKKPSIMHGQSLFSLAREDAYNNDEYAPSFLVDKVSLRSNEWKIICNKFNEDYELYNLKNDPGEQDNLIYSENEKSVTLKQRLTNYIPKNIVYRKSKENILDENSKRELMSLGYLQ